MPMSMSIDGCAFALLSHMLSNLLCYFVRLNTPIRLPTDSENCSLIDQKAQISVDTIIRDSTKVSEKTTIKRSVVGRHCIIGKMVRIADCVSVIEDGCISTISFHCFGQISCLCQTSIAFREKSVSKQN